MWNWEECDRARGLGQRAARDVTLYIPTDIKLIVYNDYKSVKAFVIYVGKQYYCKNIILPSDVEPLLSYSSFVLAFSTSGMPIKYSATKLYYIWEWREVDGKLDEFLMPFQSQLSGACSVPLQQPSFPSVTINLLLIAFRLNSLICFTVCPTVLFHSSFYLYMF